MQSFKRLYRDHYGFVWATVRRHGVQPMLVEDAVHDTFVVAYRRLDAFDGRRPKAWLYSIGRRVASTYRRTETRREARHQSASVVPMFQPDVESTVLAKTKLDEFLGSLSPEDRELFVLSEIDGLRGPELAATLGRKLPTIYSRVRVLRQRFRQRVGGEAHESRPAASARGWMLLQPWIVAPGTSVAAIAGLAFAGLAVAGLVGLLVRDSLAPPLDMPESSARVQPSVESDSTPPPLARVNDESAATRPVLPVPPLSKRIVDPPATTAVARRRPRSRPNSPTPKPRDQDAPVESTSTRPTSTLAADTTLLREANAALRSGNATRAKALLAQHEIEFPSAAQPDLRVAIWVGTLCALGDRDAARARARTLLHERPGTPVARRIEATCVGTLAGAPNSVKP